MESTSPPGRRKMNHNLGNIRMVFMDLVDVQFQRSPAPAKSNARKMRFMSFREGPATRMIL